jgi:hypothetical protein
VIFGWHFITLQYTLPYHENKLWKG